MAQIKWTEPALNDLDEIAEYVALDKPSAAHKLVKQIFKPAKLLKNFPDSGRHLPELQDTNYREIIVGQCRVFYRVEKNKVYILHIMRSEHELHKFLLEDRTKASS